MGHLDFFDALKIIFPTVFGMTITQLILHWQNRKDAQVREIRRDVIAKQFPPHGHGENTAFAKGTDVLTVEGLRYPEKNGDDK